MNGFPINSDQGFSLIEVMVALVIVGLMSSAAVLMMPSEDPGLRDQLLAFKADLTALERLSISSGRIVGLRIHGAGYQAVTLQHQSWQPLSVLSDRKQGITGVRFGLELDGRTVDLENAGNQGRPHIWFLPTGERNDFALSAKLAGQTGKLTATSAEGVRVVIDD